MTNTSRHKYLFGKTGKLLKLTKKFNEKRIFPVGMLDTETYVEFYFRFNDYFVRNDYGY